MLFNSSAFFFFLGIVLIGITCLSGNGKLFFFTVMSYLFYGFIHPWFAALLFLSTLVDYFLGRKLYREENAFRAKLYLAASLSFNLGLLAWFKYSNLMIQIANDLSRAFGGHHSLTLWTIILPAGLSFYTFQSMSYTLDIYSKKTAPAKNLLEFAYYVSFFPQLVAGPIVRASDFLEQIPGHRELEWENTVVGIELMLIGFFKKCVVADGLRPVVEQLFTTSGVGWFGVWAGAFLFSVQIYGDFSGYTDIARGLALMFGYRLPENFRWPYFSTSILSFWQRWHISLGDWIRNYVYTPLALVFTRRFGEKAIYAATFLTMFIFGLWHGGEYKYILFGIYFGVLVVVASRWSQSPARNWSRRIPSSIKCVATYVSILVGWVIFRAPTLSTMIHYLRTMFLPHAAELSPDPQFLKSLPALGFAIAMSLVHYFAYSRNYRPENRSLLLGVSYATRVGLVTLASLVIALFAGTSHTFIYFAF